MSSPPPNKPTTLKTKLHSLLSKFRSTPPHITPDQKLHLQLSTLKSQATTLNSRASDLLTQITTFSSRAASTPLPTSPPPDRDPLFDRHPTSGPASSYDAQVRAREKLVREWKVFVDHDVKDWERDLGEWEKELGKLRDRFFDPDRVVGEVEHEFIGLGNAGWNLGLVKGEIERGVAGGGGVV